MSQNITVKASITNPVTLKNTLDKIAACNQHYRPSLAVQNRLANFQLPVFSASHTAHLPAVDKSYPANLNLDLGEITFEDWESGKGYRSVPEIERSIGQLSQQYELQNSREYAAQMGGYVSSEKVLADGTVEMSIEIPS